MASHPINRNYMAKNLRDAIANLSLASRRTVTNKAKLKFIFFDWFLTLGASEIVVNNSHSRVIPGNWREDDIVSYTIEFKKKAFYLFIGDFQTTTIIWLQDPALRESFEARPVFPNWIPEVKANPSQDDVDADDEAVTCITCEFSTFFYPFLDNAQKGKKPRRRPFGSSTCSSTTSH